MACRGTSFGERVGMRASRGQLRRQKCRLVARASWDSLAHFDTVTILLHVFVDVEYGLPWRFKGHGFAETRLLRSTSCATQAGVALGISNARYRIWALTSRTCIGVTTSQARDFHVYSSIFVDRPAPPYIRTRGFSAGPPTRLGRKVLSSAGPIGIRHDEIQGNTILDPVDSGAIRLGNHGPGDPDTSSGALPARLAPPVWRSTSPRTVGDIATVYLR